MADIPSLQAALAVSPDNVPLILLLARAQLEAFCPEEARRQYERALELDPGHPEARTGLAQILDLDGKTSEAILRLEQVCQDSPDYAFAPYVKAKLLLNEGDAAGARQDYERAIALDDELEDRHLLKRIEEAGGHRKAPREDGAIPQRFGDHQAGAFFDGDEDDDEDDEGFEEGLSMAELELDLDSPARVDFDQVGGMEAVKENIRMKILYPLQNRELFDAYGKRPGGGVLLYGPPGCGKTLISRATAGEIKARFLSIGLHQILDMWIGKSEERLHQIFELARENAPSVLFFDEVDALAADRRDMRTSAGRTLINQFLAELDGNVAQNDGVLVLGATNAPWHLDSAFLRPGRFDRLVFVPPPDGPARAEIVRILAEGKPVASLDPEAVAGKTDGFSGADLKAVFDQAVEEALGDAMQSGKVVPLTSRQLVKAAKGVKPSTRKWFESAKNYALYANQSGFYDEVLDYLGLRK